MIEGSSYNKRDMHDQVNKHLINQQSLTQYTHILILKVLLLTYHHNHFTSFFTMAFLGVARSF